MIRSLEWLDTKTKRCITDAERVAELATRIANTMPDRFPAMSSSHPSQPSAASYDSDRISFAPVADPTGDRAVNSVLYGDRIGDDMKSILRALETAYRSLGLIAAVLVRYAPRASTDYDRTLASANAIKEPGCSSCERVESSKGIKRWEPVHAVTLVEGIRTALCRWCWDWNRSTGRLPSRKELTAHHDGKPVRRPA